MVFFSRARTFFFLFSKAFRPPLGPRKPTFLMGTRGLFLGDKAARV